MPDYIYKYEPFSPQSLKNLKAQSIYYGSPLEFNDPYDCAITPKIKDPSPDDIIKLRNYYHKRFHGNDVAASELSSLNDSQFKEMVVRSTRAAIQKRLGEFLATKGVTCFSEKNDNLLMWSHYGGRYKGFCLEFDTSYHPFDKLRKVTYSKEMPIIDAVTLLMHDTTDQVIDMYTTKSDAWRYEKEWRSIHSTKGTLYTYEASALTAVYFGPDIDEQSMEIICLILSGQNETVKYFRGKRSEDKFEVNFEGFDYVSHLEAKRLGLIT
ncbi:MAG: DUF2971 domain-containing protein [Chromatiales bacterium]|nr:DUF2971 domain-containing protein [Chromatiales bacterium]